MAPNIAFPSPREISRHWIVTKEKPIVIAKQLGFTEIKEDSENYWEWAIGTERKKGQRIDIYRTHQIGENEETQVFFAIYGESYLKTIPGDVFDPIRKSLLHLGYMKVHFGTIQNEHHHAFEAIEEKAWTNPDH